MDESLAELLMSRKLRTRLPTFKNLLEPQARSTSQVRYKLLSRQQRQKTLCDRGTRPLSKLREGEPVRMRRTDTPVRTTPDGVQMRRNRIHLQPTREEAPPVTSQAWEAASDAPIPITPSNMDMGIEAKVTEPQPDILQPAIPQTDQPVRRSQRIRRAPERLIETLFRFKLRT